MYFIFLQSTHCIKKTLTVSCTLLCESGERVKVDKSSFSAYLHAVMLRHHCSEYGCDLKLRGNVKQFGAFCDSYKGFLLVIMS